MEKKRTYPIDEKLVIAVASSALFDLGEADRVFRQEGEESYRSYTRNHENEAFPPGPAFHFLQRLLSVNDSQRNFEPIEVVLLSKNDADTGLRVLKSLEHYKLPITRAAFTCGVKPYHYLSAFNSVLFLSSHQPDVMEAIAAGKPAGLLVSSTTVQSAVTNENHAHPDISLFSEPYKLPDSQEVLRVAFDFDGIVVDDEAEKIFQEGGLQSFQDHEVEKRAVPLGAGPLTPLLLKLSRLQKLEFEKQKEDPSYKPCIRTAMITARSAPAHERAVKTLRALGIHVDEAFFLGGISKARILEQFHPHIFFDDQLHNLDSIHHPIALVHIPGRV